ncbi:TPA: PAS domain-containing sensor histidine kinase [Candidatus Spyradomonas excrementavium]|nr:PAS domain-containing sensor histidine kinase [Candidatus Spyradomonas excrementavium]
MGLLSFLFNNKKPKPDLDMLPDAVLVVAPNGEITDYNEKASKIFTSETIVNSELLDLFDGGYNMVCDLVKTGAGAVVRSRINEDEQFFEISAARFGEKGDIIVGVRDVSGNQKMLNKLIFEHEYVNKVTKEKNSFLSKIAGELTSPLHSINGFSQALLEGLGGEISEKQEKYLRIINKNSAQLLDLISKIVDYSKVESGIYDYEFKNFDFVDLITKIFNDYRTKAEEKGLVLTVDLNNLLKRNCFNDENLIKTALSLLLDNAIASTQNGAVKIEASSPDLEFLEIAGFPIAESANDKSYLMIKITDSGTGLVENEKDTIFNPYIDVEKAIARKSLTRNVAMGLVYNLVRLAKGKIWVETESLKGTSYTFVVPSERLEV